jgi:arginine/lysine/ornithine decarboxylase
MERETPVLNMVRGYIQNETVRFHMPGHKGDSGFFGGELLKGDITELSDTDNLMNPQGVIAQTEGLHARRTGAAQSFLCVNGSSSGVLAMICAAVAPGEKIIMARDIHVSAANALCLSGALPVFLDIPEDPVSGLPGAVSAADVEKALKEHPDASAVFITYPNYFGMCADLAAIAEAAHEADVPLLVDGAHSAHFAYSPLLPDGCAACGADAWTESLHKTLPAMNQCAVVSVGMEERIDPQRLKFFLNMFNTTSPSYILMASMDYASAYMEENGNYELYRAVSLLESAINRIQALKGLKCVGLETLGRANITDKDVLKLIIDVSGRNISGLVAKKSLEGMGVEVETADLKHILLIVTVADQPVAFDMLLSALEDLPEGLRLDCSFSPYALPETEFLFSPNEAAWCKICKMPLSMAVGFASARAVGVYPPGVPCLLPGQLITREAVNYIANAVSYGFDVFGLYGGMLTVADHP